MTKSLVTPPSKGHLGRLRRMLDPRAKYHEGEYKKSRGWWALFIIGIFVLGLPSLLAMGIVSKDKKFLKQMALVVMYGGVPFAFGGMLDIFLRFFDPFIGGSPPQLLLIMFSAFVIGFGISWYAQGKIDQQEQEYRNGD